MVPLALIVAAGATGALVALGAANRTATAYSRYIERADVSDFQINPALPTAEIDRVIRSLPGVRAVTTHSIFTAGTDLGAARTVAELESNDQALQVRGSIDGRYATMDRPALAAGRLPTGPNEAIVNVEMAEKRHVLIGDVVPLSFWSSVEVIAGEAGNPNAVVSPVGVEHVTVVGIATLPDEVLPDGLYPRERLIVSPDVAARYDCSPHALPGDVGYEDLAAAVFPDRCAISYRYYSLAVDGGPRGVAAAQDAFVRQGAALNTGLPQAFQERHIQYVLIPTTTAREEDRVDRSTQPTVTALAVLGAAAAAVTSVVAGMAIARELRRSGDDQLQWWRLGLTTRDRTQVVVVPMLLAVAAGLAAALALTWWLSPVGPVGTVRSVNPSPSREVSTWVWLGAAVLTIILAAGVTILAFLVCRRIGRPNPPPRAVSAVRRVVRGSARPAVGEGIRAAFDGKRGAGLVLTSGAIAASVFLAAVVFGASLSALVSTPQSYGWPWDVGVMSGYGYGGLDLGAIEASMTSRDDVERWTALAFTNSVAVDGEPVASMIRLGHGSEVHFTTAEGRLPTASNEVALGARTAADHGVGVGDTVELRGDNVEPRQAIVTGFAVFPALGPFESDRASTGDGMLLSPTMFDAAYLSDLVTFVGVDLVAGADSDAAVAALRDEYGAWNTDSYTVEYAEPVRPARSSTPKGCAPYPCWSVPSWGSRTWWGCCSPSSYPSERAAGTWGSCGPSDSPDASSATRCGSKQWRPWSPPS